MSAEPDNLDAQVLAFLRQAAQLYGKEDELDAMLRDAGCFDPFTRPRQNILHALVERLKMGESPLLVVMLAPKDNRVTILLDERFQQAARGVRQQIASALANALGMDEEGQSDL